MIEETKGYKRNIIWNAVAGLINAVEAVVILAVVSRVNGLKESGIVTIAFSFANLFMTIGKFGMRNYQVAHCGYDFSFKTFLRSRIITTISMVVVVALYVLFCFGGGKYSVEKSQVIFWVCMWYAVEAFEDVFAGQYQIRDRLDVGSIIFSGRWILTIAIFIITDLVSKNIVLSAVYAFGAGLCSGVIFIFYTYKKYGNKRETEIERGLWELFRNTVPLCISSFAYFYVTNIPKYTINTVLNDEIQAIYGYISMPIFVISLLNSFIYQPQLTKYVLEWREQKINLFVNRIVRQVAIIAVIILICLIGAYILGIPILSILYHENLKEYRNHLIILLIGGGFLAIAGFCANMLTIIDEQKKVMYVYLAATVIGHFLVSKLVQRFNLWGAVWGYTVSMFFMSLMFIGVLVKIIREKGAEKYPEKNGL